MDHRLSSIYTLFTLKRDRYSGIPPSAAQAGYRPWTVDCGLWTVDCGLWTVDNRLSTIDRGLSTISIIPTCHSGSIYTRRGCEFG